MNDQLPSIISHHSGQTVRAMELEVGPEDYSQKGSLGTFCGAVLFIEDRYLLAFFFAVFGMYVILVKDAYIVAAWRAL